MSEPAKASSATPAAGAASGAASGAHPAAAKSEPSMEQLAEAERALSELQGRKKRLEKELATIETNIWNYEVCPDNVIQMIKFWSQGSYLEETQAYGNIVKGYEGYLGARSDKRKQKVYDSDRIFSNSSSTHVKALDTTGARSGGV
ncbi:hypothetical protein HK101_009644 [Irineochytrium annulatum]|nr:hypothetical protein HK101_009644 [Irineochytrium annulatum]